MFSVDKTAASDVIDIRGYSTACTGFFDVHNLGLRSRMMAVSSVSDLQDFIVDILRCGAQYITRSILSVSTVCPEWSKCAVVDLETEPFSLT